MLIKFSTWWKVIRIAFNSTQALHTKLTKLIQCNNPHLVYWYGVILLNSLIFFISKQIHFVCFLFTVNIVRLILIMKICCSKYTTYSYYLPLPRLVIQFYAFFGQKITRITHAQTLATLLRRPQYCLYLHDEILNGGTARHRIIVVECPPDLGIDFNRSQSENERRLWGF